MEENNPIEACIDWLAARGFNREEAANLCCAVRAEIPERLWQDVAAWLAWCVEIRLKHDIVVLAANGVVCVEIGPGGIEDLRIMLKDGVRPATPEEIQAAGGPSGTS